MTPSSSEKDFYRGICHSWFRILTTSLLTIEALVFCGCRQGVQEHLTYVDPFIGTDYTGHTFPAASCPMGLVQPGPDTGNFVWKYCSGYNWSDSLITGFSQNHLNGTGVPSLCNILIMPFSDTCGTGWSSRKADETASPGFYSVTLPDNGVKVDITCSPRVACYKMTFSGEARRLFINFQNAQKTVSSPDPSMKNFVRYWEGRKKDDRTIAGHLVTNSWVEYDLWYEISFDTPVCSVDTLCLSPDYAAPAVVLDFGQCGPEIKARIALSYTSAEGAKNNMEEVSGWDFDKVRSDAEKSWEKVLGLIDIDAPEDVKTAFYTSMYHLYLQPNLISDKDDAARYSTFSQWDTFRAADPLRAMLTPDIEADIVNSMIDEAQSRGHLPIWDLCGKDNYCMIANHAVPTVVGACLQSLPGVDKEKAYRAVKASLTTNHKNSYWDIYDKYGYYPFDFVRVESVSRTLETCYDDWCAAQLAKELGYTEDYEFFLKRSYNYRNLFDQSSGFFRGRDSEGNWREPFEPYRYTHASEAAGDYTEANAWHYLWHVLHDPDDLMDLLGGKEKFVEKLDSLFDVSVPTSMTGELSDITGLIGQYSHGNEPCHHVIYLYTLAGCQDKAAQRLDQVYSQFYLNEPGGLCGNDDCGQMSAWYIFSALGYYPVNPASGEFVNGKALVDKAVIMDDQGNELMKISKPL